MLSVACQQWTTEANTNYYGGQGNPASTVALCQAACISNAECTGFDWVSWQAANARCWLNGPWSGGKGSSPGVTHYTLNRNCSGNKFRSLLWLLVIIINNFRNVENIIFVSFSAQCVRNKCFYCFVFVVKYKSLQCDCSNTQEQCIDSMIKLLWLNHDN